MPKIMKHDHFRGIREYLGFTHEELAERLDLKGTRQIRRWEAGTAIIPEDVVETMLALRAWTLQVVEGACDVLYGGFSVRHAATAMKHARHVSRQCREEDGCELPERWHRHVDVRVEEVLGDD